jgi:hypothetical protein
MQRALILGLLVPFLACSGPGSLLPSSSASISSFQANPASILPGQSAALTGVFAGGTGVVTPGNLSLASGLAITVAPAATTTYTLTVTDPKGLSVNKSVTLTVRVPSIASFLANPSSITAGQSARLTGIFSNGTGVITPGNLSVTSGTPVTVTPAATTTYTLTVTGVAGAPAVQTATVRVNSATADTLSILAGVPGQPGSADGQAASATFYGPVGLAVDAAGDAYIADSANNTVRLLTAAGQVSTFAGTAGYSGSADGQGASARFSNPRGLAVDAAGNVYVADFQNNTIRVIAPSGAVRTLAGTAGVSGSSDGSGAGASFSQPSAVAVDGSGKVYVADTANSTIRLVTQAGQVSTLAGKAGTTGSGDGTGARASFLLPQGLAVDAAGTLYVADTGNSTIRTITSGGQVTTLAGTPNRIGSLDGPAASALFFHPAALAVDGQGDLYVADTGNHTIRKIDSTGTVSTVAGIAGVGGQVVPGALPGQLSSPMGIAVDPVTGDPLVTSDDAILDIEF